MLILECSQGCYGRTDGQKEGRKDGRKEGRTDGRTDGSVTISFRNFVGEGIIIRVRFVVFNTSFNNSSVISRQSVLLSEFTDKLYHTMLFKLLM
jgi:hypothetical protein